MTTHGFSRLRTIAVITLFSALLHGPRAHGQHAATATPVRVVRARMTVHTGSSDSVQSPVLGIEQDGCSRTRMRFPDVVSPLFVAAAMQQRPLSMELALDVRDSLNRIDVFNTTLDVSPIEILLLQERTRAPVLEVSFGLASGSRRSCDVPIDATHGSPRVRIHMPLPSLDDVPSAAKEEIAVCMSLTLSSTRSPVSQPSSPPCAAGQTALDRLEFGLVTPPGLNGLPAGPYQTWLVLHTASGALRKVLDKAVNQCSLVDIALVVGKGTIAPLDVNARSVAFEPGLSFGGGSASASASCAPRPHPPGVYRFVGMRHTSTIELANRATNVSAVVTLQ